MYRRIEHWWFSFLILAILCCIGPVANGDVVSDCNIHACKIIADAKPGTPAANRALAILHTAVYEAANAITNKYPAGEFQVKAAPGSSIDAAVAAASHEVLAKLLPSQAAAIDKDYQATLAAIPDGAAKTAGIATGVSAAAAVLKARADDGAATPEAYRPSTTAGIYVPTVIPAFPQWPHRKPWLMTSAAQFRPGPPPTLASSQWARDFDEIKAIGAKNSSSRSEEQTKIARFWEATLPGIYHGVVRSVADQPGRDLTQNSRLFAAIGQAMDDAIIAVFDAKYFYNFWRPITAIRNADIDGNDATARDSTWTPFIETPMHPEYPCAHCIVAAAVGEVLKVEVGSNPLPTLSTTSPTAEGASRSWTTIDDFVQEVANARIYDGVHYRNSTEVGTVMGIEIGKLAAAKFLQPGK